MLWLLPIGFAALAAGIAIAIEQDHEFFGSRRRI
jgi:hypothetical protein